MSLRDALQLILLEHAAARRRPFAGDEFARFVRDEVPALVTGYLPEPERYLCVASVGKGNWAGTPWVALYDVLVTDTAQSGYYPVYLFREDLTGVYLSLNQGRGSAEVQGGR